MSDVPMNGVANQPLPPGALSAEEYRKVVERAEAEYSPEPTEDDNRQWDDITWAENDPELQQHHAGKWLAIYKRRLLAEGDDWATVMAEAQAKTGLPKHTIVTLVL